MPDPVTINSMFARLAHRYDVANHLLSFGVDWWWRRRLVSAVRKDAPSELLDLATGSGDVAFALARGRAVSSKILGMDFCQPMLDEAEAKKNRSGNADFRIISFRVGDGLALPEADASYDAVTVSFGLRNMSDRNRALTEMRRVLRPKGRLFILEFSQPQPWFRPFYYFYMRTFAPWLAGLVTGERSAYEYLCRSIEEFPNRAGLSVELNTAGFTNVSAIPMTFGIVALHEAMA